jgi:hypothetical protein
LQEIQEATESHYINGRPLHHLPSVGEISDGQSMIFVTEYSTFATMAPETIQAIFKRRHILVLSCPLPSEDFQTNTMKKYANVHMNRDILG